jgi:hypothetical protein
MSTRNLALILRGQEFRIAKRSLFQHCQLFDIYPFLFDQSTYEVQTPASKSEFLEFFSYIESGAFPQITDANVSSLSALSEEFGAVPLISPCFAQLSEARIRVLEERCSRLERVFETFQGTFPQSMTSLVQTHISVIESAISTLRSEFDNRLSVSSSHAAELSKQIGDIGDTLRSSVADLEGRLRDTHVSRLSEPPFPVPRQKNRKSRIFHETPCPLRDTDPLNGIIAYLTHKQEGNVCEKGVVSITSKSVWKGDPGHIADLNEDSFFFSLEGHHQWVQWDFREMRIVPTHYSIRGGASGNLKSWMIETSLDGTSSTEVDRQTNNRDLIKGGSIHTFPVTKPSQVRYLKLTQTGKNHRGADDLVICALEVFGTLLET